MFLSSRVAACLASGAAIALALGAACFPAPYEEVGKRCDDARHRCSEGLFCVAGRCAEQPAPTSDAGVLDDGGDVADAGTDDAGVDASVDAGPPPNLLVNPGFEAPMPDGGRPPGWKPSAAILTVDTTRVHGGQQSAHLVSTATTTATSQLSSNVPPVNAPGQDHYCAKAWVYVGADAGDYPKLLFREFNKTDATQLQFTIPGSVRGEWELIRGGYTAQGLDALEIRLQQAGAKAGDSFNADDLDLWRSQDCTER